MLTSVVKFHSPHCGHCQALAPVWDQLDAWGKTQGAVRIVAYDETVRLPEGEDLKAKHGIRVHGYPTIVKIVEVPGQPPRVVEYQGNRQLTDLVAFARRTD
jgi:thiol-disulfide isomerase/thioredoxin